MHRRKLLWSFTVGLGLTLGLLIGFHVTHKSAAAATGATESVPEPGPADAVRAQDTVSTAYVVVRFADGDVIARPITFTEPITAYTALKRTDLDLDVIDMGWGLMLCGIEGVGSSLPDDSGCDNGTRYWATSYWSDEGWVGRLAGIDSTVISQTGHIEGFSFSDPGWAAVEPPSAPALTAAADALAWLRLRQQVDGSFGSANGTAEALMAVASNGLDASTWGQRPSLLANMVSTGRPLANRNAAGAGKLAVALVAQDGCWPIGAREPISYYQPFSGGFSSDTLYQAWGILGTAALSETVPVSAAENLALNQLSSGGWEWAAGQGPDTNSTALALQALIAAGEPLTATSIVGGLTYLDNAQNDDGGFPYSPDSPWGTDSDTNSTAYAIQALLAAGEDPFGARWTIDDNDPMSYLLTMQLPDGSFEYQEGGDSNEFATRQAILALLHRPFPIAVGDIDACYGMTGRVVSRVGEGKMPLESVKMEAEGVGDLFFDTTDASGSYTISVPSVDTYMTVPTRDGFTFTPSSQSVEVTGTPGDSVFVSDFVGQTRVYLPLIVRH